MKSLDDLLKRISHLKIKLNIDQETGQGETTEQKYHLLERADQMLTPDELKVKRIQKMQKTAALIREEKKKVQQEERKKMDDMKNSGNTSMQKFIL